MSKNDSSSESSSVAMQPGANGGKLQVGNPGNKGGGRPPDKFKSQLRKARDRDKVQKYLKKCLDGEEGPSAFMDALKWIDKKVDGQDDTIPRSELYRILGEMGRIVNAYAEEYIEDPETRAEYLRRVKDAWLGIRLA